MAPPVRRPVPAARTVNFGDDEMYVGGFQLPEGDYALAFNVVMHQPTKQDGSPVGQARLGVMVDAYTLGVPATEPAHQQFFSMGSKAHLSFQPDPTTGKGLVVVEGGAGGTLPASTNWNLFRKSMVDCGLPKGIFTNDLSVLDGIWVHTQLVPEPEERKGFKQNAATSEVGEGGEERKGSGLVPVVTEIKDDGQPWSGSGGFDFLTGPATKKAGPVGIAKPAPKAAPKKATAPAPAAAAPVADVDATDDEEVRNAAIAAMTTVIEKSPHGMSKLLLKTSVFKELAASQGDDMMQAVSGTYFTTDDALGLLLGELGYTLANGGMVKPIPGA